MREEARIGCDSEACGDGRHFFGDNKVFQFWDMEEEGFV